MAPAIRNLEKLRVLVVDDEEMLRDLYADTLEQLGVKQVSIQEGAQHALDVLDEGGFDPDLIICDLNMPGIDGVEFLRHLSTRNCRAGIIVASGADTRVLKVIEDLARQRDLLLLGVLQKPITLEQLESFLLKPSVTMKLPKPVGNEQKSTTAVDIRRGLDQDEFVAYYQPQVRIKDKVVVGAEALARWNHPERGLLPPSEFIAVVEECGLMDRLTQVMLEQSVTYAQQLEQESGSPFRISINFSVGSLSMLDWPDRVDEICRQAGFHPGGVVIELTESKLLEQGADPLDILSRFRLKGMGLSIDDFGTGYSTFDYLKRLPVTELKIDRSFVSNVSENSEAQAITRSSTTLANELQLETVGEGVESDKDWSYLSQQGVTIAQGYFIAKPLSAEDFKTWVTKWLGNSVS